MTKSINQDGCGGQSVVGELNGDINYQVPNESLSFRQLAEKVHGDICKHRVVKGSCDWLLEKAEFTEWAEGQSASSVLWTHGCYGCGKSTLISRAIDHLAERRKEQPSHLLYFYVDDAQDRQRDLTHLLLTFREQALAAEEDARLRDAGASRPREEIQQAVFGFLAGGTERRPAFVVVDAVDRLAPADRAVLLEELGRLARNESSRVAVLVSSRDPCPSFLPEAREIRIEVEDTGEDVRKYLDEVLDQRLLPTLKMKDRSTRDQLKEQVLDQLTEHAAGMFLWADLQVKNICDNQTRTGVEEDIENLTLPKDMTDVYRKLAEGFEENADGDSDARSREIARRTTALLAQDTRSFARDALLVAITLEADRGQPNEKLREELDGDPGKIVRACKHLVVYSEELGIFRFCHASVYDFFRTFEQSRRHARIAELSLSHIASADFCRGPFEGAAWYNPRPLKSLLKEHPFLDFASRNWAGATIGSADESHGRLLELFEKLCGKDESGAEKANLNLSFQVYWLSRSRVMGRGVCHAHIFSYFRVLNFFEDFREKGWLDPQKCDEEGLTAIHWTISSDDDNGGINDQPNSLATTNGDGSEAGHTAPVVERLIEYGADVNAQDKVGRTPLYYASQYGKLDVVALLIAKNAQLNTSSADHGTPLIAAAYKHHEGVIAALLEAGADVRIHSPVLGTALQAICSVGCAACAAKVLASIPPGAAAAAALDSVSGHFGTALHAAAFNGHAETVDLLLLLRAGFDMRLRGGGDDVYGSALTAAAAGCTQARDDPTAFCSIFEALLASDHVDVNDDGENDRGGCLYGPPLRAAAENGHVELVRLLLDNGARVRAARGPLGTALQAARREGHREVEELLLARDPDAAAGGGGGANEETDDGSATALLLRHRVQVELFEVALRTGNHITIESLIKQMEKLSGYAIRSRRNHALEEVVEVIKDAFRAAVTLAIKEHAPESSEEGEESELTEAATGNGTNGEAPEEYSLGDRSPKEHGPDTVEDEEEEASDKQTQREGTLDPPAQGEEALNGQTHEEVREEEGAKPLVPEESFATPMPQKTTNKGTRAPNKLRKILTKLSCGILRGCCRKKPVKEEEDEEVEEEVAKIAAGARVAAVQNQAAPQRVVVPSQPSPKPALAGSQPGPEDATARRRSSSIPRTPVLKLPRQVLSFNQGSLGGDYRKVLDRLTQAAVSILGQALAQDNAEAVGIIAKAWASALSELLTRTDFGASMLEEILKNRTRELKEHLTNQNLTDGEKFQKAKGLTQVGVELSLTAVGQDLGPLAIILSELGVST